ncbi:hypothetical protein PRECH8_19250 [Insulibacter thermoxylanivorax]|uniref:Uncharacterized protein n=1 Tax=Insulibacter thermoxylanivorax TaxID=2749268 RepID=A0A916VGE7_9BACL|nr:hypothetical protein [Insulibacter thermoxylanivorax]GFR38629.1 hypothetical protein PRECH8_19250 [Insulibacter thermoxylanivorax]
MIKEPTAASQSLLRKAVCCLILFAVLLAWGAAASRQLQEPRKRLIINHSFSDLLDPAPKQSRMLRTRLYEEEVYLYLPRQYVRVIRTQRAAP